MRHLHIHASPDLIAAARSGPRHRGCRRRWARPAPRAAAAHAARCRGGSARPSSSRSTRTVGAVVCPRSRSTVRRWVAADHTLRTGVEDDRIDHAELFDRALEAFVLAVARSQVLARVVRRRRELSNRHLDEVHEASCPSHDPRRPSCVSGMSGSTPAGCCARRSRRAGAPGCGRRQSCECPQDRS